MARIPIWEQKPSVISRDLRRKTLLIFGAPKSGKTSFGSRLNKPYFLKFEEGTQALSDIVGEPIFKWTDVKGVLRDLRDPRAKEMFETIVVDTSSIAFSLCEKYICQQQNVDKISEIPFGGGYALVRNEFQETWREINLMGYGILFIAHEKKKLTEMRDSDGNQIEASAPDLPATAYSIINSMVDVIGYLSTTMNSDGSTTRTLYTRATPTIMAGSRYRYLAPQIDFGEDGYSALVNAIGEAVDKDAKLNGAVVVDHTEITEMVRRPFNDVMEEVRQFWVSYLDSAKTDEEKDQRVNIMNDVIMKIFGKPVKLSTVVKSQQDLLELVLDEFHNL